MQYQYSHSGGVYQGSPKQLHSTTRHLKEVMKVKAGDWLVAYLKPKTFYAVGEVVEPRRRAWQRGHPVHKDSVERTTSEQTHQFLDGIVRYTETPVFYDDFTDPWVSCRTRRSASNTGTLSGLMSVSGKTSAMVCKWTAWPRPWPSRCTASPCLRYRRRSSRASGHGYSREYFCVVNRSPRPARGPIGAFAACSDSYTLGSTVYDPFSARIQALGTCRLRLSATVQQDGTRKGIIEKAPPDRARSTDSGRDP